MYENIKTKGVLINSEPKRFADKKTGEVKNSTHITYSMYAPKTEYFEGGGVLTCWASVKAFELLTGLYLKEVQLELSQRPTQDGSKYKIMSVNGIKIN